MHVAKEDEVSLSPIVPDGLAPVKQALQTENTGG